MRYAFEYLSLRPSTISIAAETISTFNSSQDKNKTRQITNRCLLPLQPDSPNSLTTLFKHAPSAQPCSTPSPNTATSPTSKPHVQNGTQISNRHTTKPKTQTGPGAAAPTTKAPPPRKRNTSTSTPTKKAARPPQTTNSSSPASSPAQSAS